MAETDDCKKKCPEGTILKDGKCVLPEVTFTTLIMSLNSSALFLLGEISDPATGEKNKDMMLAKHTIDTINLLQKKTVGNLNEDEVELLDKILYDLKIRYVKVSD